MATIFDTAFDRAWALMKMPIVAGSLKPVGEGEKWQGLFEEDTKYGEENDPIPMPITVQHYGNGINASIHGNDGKRRSQLHTHIDGDIGRAHSVITEEPHRRKGYARAMYDAIAHILSLQDFDLSRSPQQSYGGSKLWDDREYMGFGEPENEHGEQIWPLGRYNSLTFNDRGIMNDRL